MAHHPTAQIDDVPIGASWRELAVGIVCFGFVSAVGIWIGYLLLALLLGI